MLFRSGSIEQDADIVMFIYRPEMYDRDTDKRNIAEIILAKHRNGPLGEFDLHFSANLTSFRDVDTRYISPYGGD